MPGPTLISLNPEATFSSVEIVDGFVAPLHAAPEPLALGANFRWTLAGSVVYSFCQWGMLSVLAKYGDASTVGAFALALAISSPVFIFTNLTLRAVQVTDTERSYRFSDYFTLRALTTLIGLVTVLAITLSVSTAGASSAGLAKINTRWVVALLAVARSIECISDILGGHFQSRERMDFAALSQMARGAMSLICFGASYVLGHSLVESSGALCAAWLSVLLLYDLPRSRTLLAPEEPFFDCNWRAKYRLARLSLPLGVVMLLVSLNGNIPRYLLERLAGPAELGIFASLAYLLLVISMVVNALGQAATVRLASWYAAGDLQSFERLLLRLVLLGASIAVAGLPAAALFGRPLLILLYRPEYASHTNVLLVMVAAAGIGSIASFLGYGLTATRNYNAQLPLTGASALVVAAVTALFAPALGMLGAAIALLASSLVLAGGYARVLLKTLSAARRAQLDGEHIPSASSNGQKTPAPRNRGTSMSPAMPDWLKAYGPQLPLATLVEVTNVLFHTVAADTYDVDHPEIHRQLPPLWAKMVALLPAGHLWNVFDLGCGTGFEAELLLSHLNDRIASLTVFDPSPAMMARCRARLEARYPRVVYCSHLEEGCAGGPFNLLVTNSLLHHLPEMDRTLAALLPHLTPDARWLSGHEPSARFFRNQDCLRLLAEYQRFRRHARWLDRSAYLSRFKRLVKRGPLARTALMALDQGIFLRRPPPEVIDRLVDFGVPRAGKTAGPALDPDLMSRQLQKDWELQWSKSYAFLGPFPVSDVPLDWAKKAAALERAFPLDGANFCTVWRRRSSSWPPPHSSPC